MYSLVKVIIKHAHPKEKRQRKSSCYVWIVNSDTLYIDRTHILLNKKEVETKTWNDNIIVRKLILSINDTIRILQF